jgi:hypothetical protein
MALRDSSEVIIYNHPVMRMQRHAIPKHDTCNENLSILRSMQKFTGALQAVKIKKPILPKVFPSAARPFSLKTSRLPTLLAKETALSENNLRVLLKI